MKSRHKRTEAMKRSNRTITVALRLSPEEREAFFQLAEKRGTDFSELARQLLHRELTAEKGKAA